MPVLTGTAPGAPVSVGLYRYLFADLLTGAVLAELPLSNVSFGSLLNSAGSLNASLALGDARMLDLDWEDATQEARTAVYVERDGALLWGGPLWTSRRSSGGHDLTLGARDFWSYLERRFITADVIFSNVDQFSIAQSLVNTAQAKRNGNIGLVVPSTTSGVLRSQTYTASQGLSVAQAVQDLAKFSGGFDFAVDLAYAGTPMAPVKTFSLNYPRRGRPASQTALVFELPGNILSYDWPRDGTQLSTTVYAQGTGDGAAMLRSTAASTALLDAGYPLLELVRPYKSVVDQAALDALAQGDLTVFSQSVQPATVLVRADADPVLGSYIVGDEARFLIHDERFPDGLDQNCRIVALNVTPPQGNTYETVTLTLGAAL